MKPLFLLIVITTVSLAQSVSPLLSRGYTVLPVPQRVQLSTGDITLNDDWSLQFGTGVNSHDIAADELHRLLLERHDFTLHSLPNAKHVLSLAVDPSAVAVTGVHDKDKTSIAAQAYRLAIAPNKIEIVGNSSAGLFYGMLTLIQLLRPQAGHLYLPQAVIEDWPDLPVRIIYWDDAHHLEHLDDLKAAIRQAAFYKINGFSLKLEGHFQFAHAPSIVDPYALSPAEYQELTDYAVRYHVQLIPYLDAPGHVAFILKHPEYASLREYPESNYEFCSTNPDTYRLLENMFSDLLAANKGGKYFVLSTDEPYYVGLAENAQCHEAARAKELGSVGKMLAEFVTKTADYLTQQGRTVIFWGEYPMKPEDINSLPGNLINGEVYGPQFDPVFRAHGIRQLVYTFTEAEEQMFPRYYVFPSPAPMHNAEDSAKGRVQDMVDSITFTSTANLSSTRPDSAHPDQADVMGVFIAGWADAGLHPETFWLGYATGPAAAWNRSFTNVQEMQASFYSLFYGQGEAAMGRIYQLMSEGAQIWHDTWETGPSARRKPIWGNSYAIFNPPQPAHDQYLPPLPVPHGALLHIDGDWAGENKARLDLAERSLQSNDELLDLLYSASQRVKLNRYNLEIYLSVARLYRQNLFMLENLAQIAAYLNQAETLAGQSKAKEAVEAMDHALDLAAATEHGRNVVLRDATATWYKSWQPRVASANGRSYLHELDDVKDHVPDRTVDMSYLVYRELNYPLGDWADAVVLVRNQYATAHGIDVRDVKLDWQNTSEIHP